jgi:hypothetical protein
LFGIHVLTSPFAVIMLAYWLVFACPYFSHCQVESLRWPEAGIAMLAPPAWVHASTDSLGFPAMPHALRGYGLVDPTVHGIADNSEIVANFIHGQSNGDLVVSYIH